MASDEALYNTLFNGAYLNPIQPLWISYTSTNITGPDIAVSTLTVNPYTAGNILLQADTVSGTEYRAPLIFQRPQGDINAPSESLVMNLSHAVPTKPIDGEFITATKAAGTAYDDIAVSGLQIFGDQTTSGNSGACGYITCGQFPGTLSIDSRDVFISSLSVSSLNAVNVISSTTSAASNYTASQWMSTPILYSQDILNGGNIQSETGKFSSINVRWATISTAQISTASISTANISTANINKAVMSTAIMSTMTAGNFNANRIDVTLLSSITGDITFNLVSTLSLFGNVDVNLGLGNQIAGLIGGAASQGLGVGLGGAALITGAVALVTGRTSGGADPTVFQTVNGSTQLQFSTIGTTVNSVFLTTNSTDPLHTPGTPLTQVTTVPAGTYCVRSVGDPLNIQNNISAIQMFGQWVPVIQPTATIPQITISTLNISTAQIKNDNVSSLIVSSINGQPYTPGGTFAIPSTIALSSVTVNGNLTQSGTGTLNWANNTLSPTQVVLSQPTSVNNTLTTSGAAFLNAGLTVNGPSATFGAPTAVTVQNNLTVNGLATIGNISTNVISSANINLSSINGAVYPPTTGTPTIPSTLALSSVTVNGNLTQSGNGTLNWAGNTLSPTQVVLARPTAINNTLATSGLVSMAGGLSVNGGPVNFNVDIYANRSVQVNQILNVYGQLTAFGVFVAQGANASFGAGTPVTIGNSLQVNGTMNVNGITTINNTARITDITANTIAASNTVTGPFGTFSNINLSSINGAAYPPGGGGSGGIPSTLLASTITFNGGLSNIGTAPLFSGQINASNITVSDTITSVNANVTNVRATDINLSNTGGTITGNGQIIFQLASVASNYSFRNSAGTNTSYIAEFYSNQTSRFFSTLTVRDTTFPIIGPSFARVQTYDPSYDSQPWGTVLTSNVSTTTANFNTGFTNLLNAASISSINTSARYIAASNITASNVLIATQFSTNAANFMSFNNGTTTMFDVGLDTSSDIPGSYTLEMTPINTNLGIIKATTLQTYYANIPGSPYIPAGRIFTSSISTVFTNTNTLVAGSIASGNISTNVISTGNLIASYISTSLLLANNISTSNINTNTINSAPYPPPSGLPSGAVFIWGGVTVASVPSGWLICDGSLVSATTYANLFAVIGNSYTKYPNIPVVGSFYLPDLTYAIPQNPPTPTYAATITVKTFQGTLINYPGLLDTNCLWQITGFPTNTLNIGTVFPKAQIPGAAYDIYISDIIALQSSGDTFSPPFIVKVIYAPPGSAVLPLIASNISITSAGALTNPASTYWKPGTYNIASDGNPNPWSSPPLYNLYNQLNPAQIPEHQHYMAAPSSGTPPPGPGAINSATVQPYFAVSTPTSAQTNAFGISTNITLYQPLLYPTMPNIINMFYIIKT
jgi:hypothetical protein